MDASPIAPSPLPDAEASRAPPVEEAPRSGSPAVGSVALDLRDVRTYFYTYDGVVRALDGVTLKVRHGETTGLVGETGCGKSVTAFSVMRLISDPPGRIMGGEIRWRDANLLWGLDREASYRPVRGTKRVKVRRSFRRIKAADERMSAVRGRGIAMIFQEPTQAMNPVFSIANQVGELLLIHRGPEVIRSVLDAAPDAPGVAPAIEKLAAAAATHARRTVHVAATELGTAARSPRLGTEAYYLALAVSSPHQLRADLRRAVRRLKLSRVQRRYLAHRQRLLELDERLKTAYFGEMRDGHLNRRARGTLTLRRTAERLSHGYFRLWGLRGYVERPLHQELFWRVVRLMEGVSIANPVQVARGYPHELSGGMLQRVMIAMALSADPDVLIADEPTTALDVTIQAQILDLMKDLKQRVGTAILLITHDLAVVAEVADRVCVMYAGEIVEEARVSDLFRHPLHPYTQGLLASIPRVDKPEKELLSIPGSVPNLIEPPSGCRFHPRCPYAMPVCREARPPVTEEGPDHAVACYLYKGPRLRA